MAMGAVGATAGAFLAPRAADRPLELEPGSVQPQVPL